MHGTATSFCGTCDEWLCVKCMRSPTHASDCGAPDTGTDAAAAAPKKWSRPNRTVKMVKDFPETAVPDLCSLLEGEKVSIVKVV